MLSPPELRRYDVRADTISARDDNRFRLQKNKYWVLQACRNVARHCLFRAVSQCCLTHHEKRTQAARDEVEGWSEHTALGDSARLYGKWRCCLAEVSSQRVNVRRENRGMNAFERGC
jgi:hypothetical protein